MIIIGTYPDPIDEDGFDGNKLRILEKYLTKILPQDLCLHLLPFYPSSGDFGFAPNDWFKVRDDLGNWEDIKRISNKWKVIVDGIYNHVGIQHKWYKEFILNPEINQDKFYVYNSINQSEAPFSPRGQNEYVLRRQTNGYLVWQTFSNAAVDINLSNEEVLYDIIKQIDLLKENGVWGIRLDAIAYYVKKLGSQIRHNDGVYLLANKIVKIVESKNMYVIAQLDCDEDGIKYFIDRKGRNSIPISDFTYSTFFILSLINQNPKKLIEHIDRTDKSGKILIRTPRTHDGVLLRSKLLEKEDVNAIIEFSLQNQIKIRKNNNIPYELNCSAPYLYSKAAKGIEINDIILFSVAITGMLSGWVYFYLPYLIGYVPEYDYNFLSSRDEDPRALNRTQIKKDFLKEFFETKRYIVVKSLLKLLSNIRKQQDVNFKSKSIIEGSMLVLTTKDNLYRLVANFSTTNKVVVSQVYLLGELQFSQKFNKNILDKLGFALFKI